MKNRHLLGGAAFFLFGTFREAKCVEGGAHHAKANDGRECRHEEGTEEGKADGHDDHQTTHDDRNRCTALVAGIVHDHVLVEGCPISIIPYRI